MSERVGECVSVRVSGGIGMGQMKVKGVYLCVCEGKVECVRE